jgi:hypothetical protein
VEVKGVFKPLFLAQSCYKTYLAIFKIDTQSSITIAKSEPFSSSLQGYVQYRKKIELAGNPPLPL